jgi:hypothetical protein
MKVLISSELCFDKTENDRFQSNSGGVFLTQGLTRIMADASRNNNNNTAILIPNKSMI